MEALVAFAFAFAFALTLATLFFLARLWPGAVLLVLSRRFLGREDGVVL
jgi:hypothetical protein